MNIIHISSDTFNNYITQFPVFYSYYLIENKKCNKKFKLKVFATQHGIFKAFFEHNLNQANLYSHAQYVRFEDLNFQNLLVTGTDFQVKTWKATAAIPAGTTLSYQELAYTIGNPRAYRAVARALAHNEIAYFIPCHRVIRSDKKHAGYKWGAIIKSSLLEQEKIDL